MKNRAKQKFRGKLTRKQLKKMINDENQIGKVNELLKDSSYDELKMYIEIMRESRIDKLFDKLNVDSEKSSKVRKKVIKITPKSKYHLISSLFKNHNGKYKVETLLNQFHDDTLREGLIIGENYGKKFIVEDIQNNRFSKEDIMNMTGDEILEYCDEIREEI